MENVEITINDKPEYVSTDVKGFIALDKLKNNISLNSNITVAVKNSPYYEDNSTVISFRVIPTVTVLTLKPKDAPAQIIMKLVDKAHNMPIPNLKIEAAVNSKTYTGTSDERGELSLDVDILSQVKGKQITFSTADPRFVSQFNAVSVTQAKTQVTHTIEAHFALLAVLMKGTTGLPLVKVEFKLNNAVVSTTLSDYNGKAVCFVKKDLLTDYQ